jgi:hypothetical protein
MATTRGRPLRSCQQGPSLPEWLPHRHLFPGLALSALAPGEFPKEACHLKWLALGLQGRRGAPLCHLCHLNTEKLRGPRWGFLSLVRWTSEDRMQRQKMMNGCCASTRRLKTKFNLSTFTMQHSWLTTSTTCRPLISILTMMYEEVSQTGWDVGPYE